MVTYYALNDAGNVLAGVTSKYVEQVSESPRATTGMKPTKITNRAPLICFLLATSMSGAFAQVTHPKLASDAVQAANQQSVSVIIQYKVKPAAGHITRIGQLGGSARHSFTTIPAIAAQIPGSALSQLEQDPDVAYITTDRPLGSKAAWYSAEPVNAPSVWNNGIYGTGVGVAVIDSGITSNLSDLGISTLAPTALASLTFGLPAAQTPPVPPALQPHGARVVYEQNFLTQPNGQPLPNTNDQYGHGTHVAGIIAGNGNKSIGAQFSRSFIGIAPDANLIDLQVLDQNGLGTDSNVIAAIETAINLKNIYNIRVINLSLGRPVYESYTQDPLCQAVEQAWKAGIVVVVAAGNDGRLESISSEGYGTINSPGNDPYVLTVGATDTNATAAITDDTVASYSSKGPSLIDDVAKPDIMAPGSQIASLRQPPSTLVKDNPTLVTYHSDYMVKADAAPSADYFPLSGTSMASAVTSGAAALLLDAEPNLTPDQVKALFMRDAAKNVFPASSTVTDATGSYTAYNDMLTVGAGYLNIQASLADAQAHVGNLPSGYALSPIVTLNPLTNMMSLNFHPQSLWVSDTTWAPAALYGSQAFEDSEGGSTIIWGNTTITGSTIIWGRSSVVGSTIIWGRSTVDGSTIIWGRSDADASESAATLLY